MEQVNNAYDYLNRCLALIAGFVAKHNDDPQAIVLPQWGYDSLKQLPHINLATPIKSKHHIERLDGIRLESSPYIDDIILY